MAACMPSSCRSACRAGNGGAPVVVTAARRATTGERVGTASAAVTLSVPGGELGPAGPVGVGTGVGDPGGLPDGDGLGCVGTLELLGVDVGMVLAEIGTAPGPGLEAVGVDELLRAVDGAAAGTGPGALTVGAGGGRSSMICVAGRCNAW